MIEHEPMAPHSEAEYNFLKHLVQSIPYFPQLNLHEQNKLIENLSAYECYSQCIELLEWRISNAFHTEQQQFSDFILIMTLWYAGCENWEKFIEVANRCISKLKLGFTTTRIQISQPILGKDRYDLLAKFYEQILESLFEKEELIMALEHLAFLREKKLFADRLVEETYDKILELDPGNSKALKFYKLNYVQNARWKEAARTLVKMVEHSPPGFEQNRASFELAQIYLYQLNQPQRAKEILDQIIHKTAIDIRQTYIEALERLGATEALIVYLNELETRLRNPEDKCENKQRLGLVYLRNGQPDLAIAQFGEALRMNPKSLEIHEARLNALIEARRNAEIVETLKSFQSALESEKNKEVFSDLIQKIVSLA